MSSQSIKDQPVATQAPTREPLADITQSRKTNGGQGKSDPDNATSTAVRDAAIPAEAPEMPSREPESHVATRNVAQATRPLMPQFEPPSSAPSAGTLRDAFAEPPMLFVEPASDTGFEPDSFPTTTYPGNSSRVSSFPGDMLGGPLDSTVGVFPPPGLTVPDLHTPSDAKIRALQLEMHLSELAARQASAMVEAERASVMQRQRDALLSMPASAPPTLLDASSLRAMTNIYVNNLPESTTDDVLYRLGSMCGTVVSHKAMLDLDTGRCKGYGFVMYATPEEAQRAIIFFTSNGLQSSYAKESFSAKLRRMADKSSTNVYLSNLPVKLNAQQLEQLFSPHPVVSLRILTDANGESRGVGFVRLRDREVAQECIERLHGRILPGTTQPLQVRFADSEAQKQLKQSVSPKRTIESLFKELNMHGMTHPPLSGPTFTAPTFTAPLPAPQCGGGSIGGIGARQRLSLSPQLMPTSPSQLTASPDLSTSSSFGSLLSTPSTGSLSSGAFTPFSGSPTIGSGPMDCFGASHHLGGLQQMPASPMKPQASPDLGCFSPSAMISQPATPMVSYGAVNGAGLGFYDPTTPLTSSFRGYGEGVTGHGFGKDTSLTGSMVRELDAAQRGMAGWGVGALPPPSQPLSASGMQYGGQQSTTAPAPSRSSAIPIRRPDDGGPDQVALSPTASSNAAPSASQANAADSRKSRSGVKVALPPTSSDSAIKEGKIKRTSVGTVETEAKRRGRRSAPSVA
ncbi:uncharacterized protein PFL1_05002 [Pseudozyma flocculosa PF-1]|uniref:RRM domain-containing protein n=1 Tax=Pseudozyma flocculosa PF-1 TaxID=1277687 RepID=A0A061H4U9_9BASI|nr:uncharacterized protein PFL1_05002 [Pseudozyma flocculosa PF-1]EPQ27464.1 hypothetical protein PFL1_05002 [Pseudozyma flocculosa PF-1]